MLIEVKYIKIKQRQLSVFCYVHVFLQVNLMQYMKLSTSRDFRINAATLDAALQEQEETEVVSENFTQVYS